MASIGREPLPAGAVIEYCGEHGEVIHDPGGEGRVTVKVGDHQAQWSLGENYFIFSSIEYSAYRTGSINVPPICTVEAGKVRVAVQVHVPISP